MPCTNLSSGYQLACSTDSIGGIKWVGLTELSNLISLVQDATYIVTAITMSSATYFYKFDCRDTSSFTDVLTKSVENQTQYAAQALQLIINKADSTKQNQVKLMAQNPLLALIAYSDGSYKLAGYNRGLDFVTGAHGSGVAIADRNGYDINFVGNQSALAPYVSSSIVAAITSY